MRNLTDSCLRADFSQSVSCLASAGTKQANAAFWLRQCSRRRSSRHEKARSAMRRGNTSVGADALALTAAAATYAVMRQRGAMEEYNPSIAATRGAPKAQPVNRRGIRLPALTASSGILRWPALRSRPSGLMARPRERSPNSSSSNARCTAVENLTCCRPASLARNSHHHQECVRAQLRDARNQNLRRHLPQVRGLVQANERNEGGSLMPKGS